MENGHGEQDVFNRKQNNSIDYYLPPQCLQSGNLLPRFTSIDYVFKQDSSPWWQLGVIASEALLVAKRWRKEGETKEKALKRNLAGDSPSRLVFFSLQLMQWFK